METKAQRMPLPVSVPRLQEVVSLILKLPQLQEMRLMLTGIEVKRAVEDEDVIPQTILEIGRGLVPDKPGLDFLLKSVRLEALPVDFERHPLHTLIHMTRRIHEEELYPCAWYVTEGDHLDAYLGQAKGTLVPWLLGVPVNYVSEDQLPDGRIVLVGSPTRYSIDATFAVTADMGG